jgi:hypothetical protein
MDGMKKRPALSVVLCCCKSVSGCGWEAEVAVCAVSIGVISFHGHVKSKAVRDQSSVMKYWNSVSDV